MLVAQNSAALESQIEARPLAKLQEEIDGAEGGEEGNEKEGDEAAKEAGKEPQSNAESGETQPADDERNRTDSPRPRRTHKALLNNDDTELQRVQKASSHFYAVRRYVAYTSLYSSSMKFTAVTMKSTTSAAEHPTPALENNAEPLRSRQPRP